MDFGTSQNKGFSINLATLCTIIAVMLSFVGIIFVLNEQYLVSFGFILTALWFDMLDGHVARKLNQESSFGANLDLLQDVINYLLYPAVLFYQLGFQGSIAIVLLLVFVITGLLRLARFHATGFSEEKGNTSYIGMPVYCNHIIVLLILLLQKPTWQYSILMIALPIASALMVSQLQFPKPRSVILWTLIVLGMAAYFFTQ